MKSVYERTDLIITEFDIEDVIATSGVVTPEPAIPSQAKVLEKENRYGTFTSFDLKDPGGGSWF